MIETAYEFLYQAGTGIILLAVILVAALAFVMVRRGREKGSEHRSHDSSTSGEE